MVSIFCDFDATISVYDVGDSLFQEFGDYFNCWNRYATSKIDIRELNRQLCGSIRNDLTLKYINNWAITKEIDVYFLNFINYCNTNQYSITVVSDGYDAYIEPLLSEKQIKIDINPTYSKKISNINYLSQSHISVFCNILNKDDSGFYPEFFGADEGCICSTASCKRNVILNNSKEDDIVIYIGDGHTDFCPAEHSDIVFAKSKLARYCNENKIPHYPYKSFFDVIRILENCKSNNKLRHRHQALMKRKKAFELE